MSFKLVGTSVESIRKQMVMLSDNEVEYSVYLILCLHLWIILLGGTPISPKAYIHDIWVKIVNSSSSLED